MNFGQENQRWCCVLRETYRRHLRLPHLCTPALIPWSRRKQPAFPFVKLLFSPLWLKSILWGDTLRLCKFLVFITFSSTRLSICDASCLKQHHCGICQHWCSISITSTFILWNSNIRKGFTFSHLFIYSIILVWIHGYLFLTMSYNPILSLFTLSLNIK